MVPKLFTRPYALSPDLIVLDLSMPSANGVEVALMLSSRKPRTPVILYTMFDEVFGRSSARTLGIAAIVAKSDGVIKLLYRIEDLLNTPEGLSKQEHWSWKSANRFLPPKVRGVSTPLCIGVLFWAA
jgi:DNA-binding NarL/FixJ family response regulator